MSGKRRAPDRGTEQRSDTVSGTATSHSVDLDEQSLLGNQAVFSRIHGGDDDGDPVSVARDLAIPMIDRGGLALQFEGVGDGPLARFRSILEASQLDRVARDSVLGRLDTREAVARDVSEAVRAVFGEDTDDLRDRVARDLDRVFDALKVGESVDGALELSDGTRVELTGEGNRVQSLVTGVGDAVASVSGAQILAFCQRVHLALMLDEDEDEDDAPGYPAES